MKVTDATVISPAAHLEHVAIEVSKIAARFVQGQRGAPRAVGTKSTLTDVVTETDLQSESIIRRELVARCPGSSIVGEEYDDAAGQNNVRWIVDPIDGTVNFLYGLPVLSVSIAAMINEVTVAGAVTDVASCTTWSARIGDGSRFEGEPVHVSRPDKLDTALIGTGFAYDASLRGEQAEVLSHLLPACRDIRCMGSAALNLCWVASGMLDAFFERDIKIYDYAAGALIASEAGAIVELPAGGTDLTVAAPPAIADALLRIVRSDRTA